MYLYKLTQSISCEQAEQLYIDTRLLCGVMTIYMHVWMTSLVVANGW